MVSTRALAVVATAAYAANCTLGAAVRTGVVDTSRSRWVHHALYVVTISSTAVAALAGLQRGDIKGVVLAPALLPLAFLPFLGREVHTAVGLAPAPWFVGSALLREEA